MGGKEIAVLLILMAALFFSSGTTESTGEFIAIRTNHIRNNEFDLQAAGFVDNPATAPEPKAPELKTLQCCLWGFGWEASLWRRPRVCKSWCWKPNPHQLVSASAPAPVSVPVPPPVPSPAPSSGFKRLKCCLWEFDRQPSLWRRRRICKSFCYD